MVIETLLGSLGGGLLRLAPEILNWFDRKDSRRHELLMQDKALQFEQLRGAQRMAEMGAQNQMVLDEGGLNALIESIKAQAMPSGVKWVDALSTSVRPILTYWWCMVLFTGVKIAQYLWLRQEGNPGLDALLMLWGDSEMVIVSGMLNFWFLDRVIRKNTGV